MLCFVQGLQGQASSFGTGGHSDYSVRQEGGHLIDLDGLLQSSCNPSNLERKLSIRGFAWTASKGARECERM